MAEIGFYSKGCQSEGIVNRLTLSFLMNPLSTIKGKPRKDAEMLSRPFLLILTFSLTTFPFHLSIWISSGDMSYLSSSLEGLPRRTLQRNW